MKLVGGLGYSDPGAVQGMGSRSCIGEFLARIEMQIHLITIGRELRMQRDETKPPEMVAGVNLLSKDAFIMTPELKTFCAR